VFFLRRNKQWTVEEKLEAVLRCLDENVSRMAIANKVGCHPTIINKWIYTYRQNDLQRLGREIKKLQSAFKYAFCSFKLFSS
jgi:transposase-like protein